MRMDKLLADLEAAHAALQAAEARLELAEGVRTERAKVSLADRLRASHGQWLVVETGAGPVRGKLVDVGIGWCALDRTGVRPAAEGFLPVVGACLVRIAAIEAVVGLGPRHEADTESSIGRSWGSVLRAVARSRLPVVWHRVGGGSATGVIDAVGADHVMVRRSDGAVVALTLDSLASLECGGAGAAGHR